MVGRVVDEVIGSDRGDSDLEARVVDIIQDNLDMKELGAQMLKQLLTEENTDRLIQLLDDKINFPLGADKLLWRLLDRQMPEAILDPLLKLLEEKTD